MPSCGRAPLSELAASEMQGIKYDVLFLCLLISSCTVQPFIIESQSLSGHVWSNRRWLRFFICLVRRTVLPMKPGRSTCLDTATVTSNRRQGEHSGTISAAQNTELYRKGALANQHLIAVECEARAVIGRSFGRSRCTGPAARINCCLRARTLCRFGRGCGRRGRRRLIGRRSPCWRLLVAKHLHDHE